MEDNKLAIHHVGELAYIDTLCNGLVPCKVIAIDTLELERRMTSKRLTVKVTASVGAYLKGEVIKELTSINVIPRESVYRSRQHCGQLRIRNNYKWE